ncbi:CSE1_5 [Sanghuangporus vaninii]
MLAASSTDRTILISGTRAFTSKPSSLASSALILLQHASTPAILSASPTNSHHAASDWYDGVVRIWDVRSTKGAMASFRIGEAQIHPRYSFAPSGVSSAAVSGLGSPMKASNFERQETIDGLVEGVVVPNVSLGNHDQSSLKTTFSNILTAEGTTRHQAAADVLRALVASGYVAVTTENAVRWIGLGLQEYASDPRGEDSWKRKDWSVYLLTAVAVLRFLFAKRIPGPTDRFRRGAYDPSSRFDLLPADAGCNIQHSSVVALGADDLSISIWQMKSPTPSFAVNRHAMRRITPPLTPLSTQQQHGFGHVGPSQPGEQVTDGMDVENMNDPGSDMAVPISALDTCGWQGRDDTRTTL